MCMTISNYLMILFTFSLSFTVIIHLIEIFYIDLSIALPETNRISVKLTPSAFLKDELNIILFKDKGSRK